MQLYKQTGYRAKEREINQQRKFMAQYHKRKQRDAAKQQESGK
ncbi:hypothetical protein ADINL_0038 [Nitrincola lacisaponensis]|uniref:Uncharacterized protein n=1 Tax=Nitrincola lacisaponensis TaxID=267850 RepID=A0A063Y4V9_9GAMM|nr:hypothetical protein [Nitrincola lacisaponensis]KDE41358.1 hypothetical protein ADINL_0038 [Nitrincola lacisaponensis]